jgi:hypothetical protein
MKKTSQTMMKRAILSLLIICFSIALSGQEIEVKGIYAVSTGKNFQNTFGCGFGYNQFITPKNRLGVFIEYTLNKTYYEESYTSTADLSRYIREVEPDNHRIAFKLNYAFNLLKSPKSLLFLGPEIGLNYFILNEEYQQTVITSLDSITSGHFSSSSTVDNRIGIGFLIEYERKDLIYKRISASLSMHPEVIIYHTPGMKGTHDASLIGWLNFNIGVKYRFGKEE